MQLKFLAIVLGGLLLSIPLIAAQPKASTAPTIVKKMSQKHPTAKDLKNLDKARRQNDVFDNYSTGGTAYEPY